MSLLYSTGSGHSPRVDIMSLEHHLYSKFINYM